MEGCQYDNDCSITTNRCKNGECKCGIETAPCSGIAPWCLLMNGTTPIAGASNVRCQV